MSGSVVALATIEEHGKKRRSRLALIVKGLVREFTDCAVMGVPDISVWS